MIVTRVSMFTLKTHTREIDVTPEQLAEIDTPGRQRLVQDIVPHLSPGDREFLKTGVTSEEWRSLYDDPEEDEND